MDVTFHYRMEEYYQRFIDLQEKLRKSEEERLKLEIKFNELLQKSREEEQAHYRKLRSQYKRFLDEDRKRQDRNEKILRALERIESRVNSLMSKTERFKVLRRQYKSYLDGISTRPKSTNYYKDDCDFAKQQEESSSVNPQVQRKEYEKKFGNDNDEKMAILDRYLRNFHSKGLETNYQPPSMQQQHSRKDNENIKTLDDLSNRLSQTFDSNKANSIAEDIMNSIYNRHYKKDTDPLLEIVQKHQPNQAAGPKVSDLDSDNEDFDLQNKSKYNQRYSRDGTNERIRRNPNYQIINDTNLRNPVNLDNEIINNFSYSENCVQPIKEIYKDSTIPQVSNNNTNGLRKRVDFEESHFKLSDEIFPVISDLHHISPPDSNKPGLNPSNTSQTTRNTLDKEYHNRLKYNNDDDNQSEVVQLGALTSICDEDGNYNNANQQEKQYNYENKRPTEETYDHQIPPEQHLDGNIIKHQSNQQSDELIEPHSNENDTELQQNTNEILQQFEPNDNPSLDQNIQISQPVIHPQFDQQNNENNHIVYQEHNETSQPLLYQQTVDCGQPLAKNFDENIETIGNQEHKTNNQQLDQYYEENGEKHDRNIEPVPQLSDDTGQPEIYQQTAPENQLYDQNGKPLFNQQYDQNGQPVIDHQQYAENDQIVNQHYDENSQRLLYEQYDRNDHLVNQQYDANGQPTIDHQEYDENGQPVGQQYDENGHPIIDHQQYDENGQLVGQQYDENGQPIIDHQQYDENGHLIGQQYDENGQPVIDHQHYDENGHLVGQQYDDNGQPINVNQQYDENGQLIGKQYDENGQQFHQQYEGNSQPIIAHQPYGEKGQLVDQQYDENGHPVFHQEYDENGQPIYHQYDGNGQAIAQEYDENGHPILVEQQQYDENGQPILVEQQQYDESGQPYLQQYHEYGQPVGQFNENCGPTNPQYDENGQPIIETQYDANGQPIYPQYDENGQPVAYAETYDANSYEQTPQQFESKENNPDGLEPKLFSDAKDGNPSNRDEDNPKEYENETLEGKVEEIARVDIKKSNNVLDLLDTDTESAKQNTSKISHDDSDFDFSNG